MLGVNANAKARLQEHEDGACGPGLRRAGHWIKGRALSLTAIDSAEEFGKSMKFDCAAQVEQAHQDASGEFALPIACHAGSDQGIVVGPNRAVVVRQRVVTGLVTAYRANTPSAEKVAADERVSDQARSFGVDNS